MRKVFIDGGANKGQSTKKFLSVWPDSDQYEIFMFEPNSKAPWIRGSKTKLVRKALWIYDGEIDFYEKQPNSEANTILKQKVSLSKARFEKHTVKCISLSKWILDNFKKDDYIILKLDVECAEYKIIKDLHENRCLSFVNLLFCEIHGLKCGKNYDESLDLVKLCNSNNLNIYNWDADTFAYDTYQTDEYNEEFLNKEYKKWKKRGL